MRGDQHRPACPVCHRWRRRDHRCPGPPSSTQEAPQAPAVYHDAPFLKKYGS